VRVDEAHEVDRHGDAGQKPSYECAELGLERAAVVLE
jgi:hypothetical protein